MAGTAPLSHLGRILNPGRVESDQLVGLPSSPAGYRWIWRLLSDRAAVAGLVIVTGMVVLAVFGPMLAPRSPTSIDPAQVLTGPRWAFPFGTDNLGRDILSRVIDGARVSISLALLVGASAVVIGVGVGTIAGYAGSWVDGLAMRVVDVFLAFPALILALAIAGTIGAGEGGLLVALIVTWWPPYARLARAGVLAERERDYVYAARGLGARPGRLLLRHILPNVLPATLVLLSFDLGAIILAIAALGYLGVGIRPPTPEWGTMISDAQNYVFTAPQMIIFPGLAVFVAVVGFNLLGEGINGALDPRRRRPVRSPSRPPAPSARPDPAAVAAGLLVVDSLQTRVRAPRGEVHAVDGVSLRVEPGETVGLVGESGCGKTMTALSIMRLLPPGGRIAGGRVVLDGEELTALQEPEMRRRRGRRVAMVFQDPLTCLNPAQTIGFQIAAPLRHHEGLSAREARIAAGDLLVQVGFPRPSERLDDYPHQLSGGQRQRVMIAMALACKPKLLIADEPTTALDVTIQGQILALLDDLQARLGMGLLLITHDMGVVAGRCDRVVVMYAGRVVEEGRTELILTEPRHPYTRALLDSIPALHAHRSRRLASIPGQPPDLVDPPPGCRFAPRCARATEECVSADPLLRPGPGGGRFACFHPLAEQSVVSGDPGGTAGQTQSADIWQPSRQPPAGGLPLAEIDRVIRNFRVQGRGWGSARLHAVSDVSFAVGHGEIFGLAGESGCGKTTLGRMLVALDKPDAGAIRLEGTDLAALSGTALRRQRRDLQMVFQDSYASLNPRMRIGAALREPLDVHAVGTPAERRVAVLRLLDGVGLPADIQSRYPHELSAGQRQRAGLARAMALGPALVVADEPVSSLDVSVRSQILNLIRELQAARGLSFVVISHDLAVLRYLADRVGVMYLGKLVEVGPATLVFEAPGHPYTAALLAAVPDPEPGRRRAGQTVQLTGELPSAIDPPSGCRFRTRCPRAQARCASEEPPLRAFQASGHEVACHFPLSPDPVSG